MLVIGGAVQSALGQWGGSVPSPIGSARCAVACDTSSSLESARRSTHHRTTHREARRRPRRTHVMRPTRLGRYYFPSRESTARHAPVLPAALETSAAAPPAGACLVRRTYLRHAGPHELYCHVAADDPDRIEPLSARPAVRDLQREREVNTPTRGRDPVQMWIDPRDRGGRGGGSAAADVS